MIEVRFHKILQGQAGQLELDIEMNLEGGKFYALMGESGAGKTSILKAIAGLMRPERGFIRYKENIWYDDKTGVFVSPQKRKVGFVFQDYALFPNMTVEQNLTYALNNNSDRALMGEILELMDLKSLIASRPLELSGGQQQRVALARAILQQPDVVLLDEPLSALDKKMRKKLQDDLKSLQSRYGFTTLMVTHDESEVGKLAEVVFILEKGKISKKGAPLHILNPAISLERIRGEVLFINKEKSSLVVSNAKGIFEIELSQERLSKAKVGQQIEMKSKEWDINE